MQVKSWSGPRRQALAIVALCCFWRLGAGLAQAPTRIVIDDFENGVGAWSRNDKVKAENSAADVLLVDIAPSKPAPGGAPGSKGAGLFAFKGAQNAWASASIAVDGARWAQGGAQRLTFWLNAGGEAQGVGLVLRGHYTGADGASHEEVFELPFDPQTKRPKPIKLTVKQWRKVVIPLTDFRSVGGPLPPRLNDIYLLQFVQRGTWSSRFFTIDDLGVEGNGVPVPQTTGAPPAGGTNTSSTTTASTVAVNVDYLRLQGKVRPAANVSIGASLPTSTNPNDFPLTQSDQFRSALQTLAPRLVRLDAGSLTELVDSSKPGFDFSKLLNAVKQTRALGFEPLLALTNPPAWGLEGRSYAQFAVQAAHAINMPAQQVRYFELATAPDAVDDTAAIALYNGARVALKAASPRYQVGGITASSGRTNTMAALLKGAVGLDFLSVQYFGGYEGTPAPAALYSAARDVKTLREAATALDASRWRNVPIFVTQSNLNAARNEGGEATDARVQQMIAASWWITFMGNAARVSDQVFHNDAIDPEWGLLDTKAQAYPTYYALWMWNSFIPPGSQRVEVRVARPDIAAIAVNTLTAHNLLLTNTTNREQTARVGIRGFSVLRSARIRVLQDRKTGVQPLHSFKDLPKSPYQTVTLKPYAIAVLQFIEPPRTH